MTTTDRPDRVTSEMPAPTLGPLHSRFTTVGIVEHSVGSEPDPTSGHCTDDAGRALAMAALLSADERADEIAIRCLHQLSVSRSSASQFHLRLDAEGRPTDDPPSDDATARAIWGLALAATRIRSQGIRSFAMHELDRLSGFRSPFPRAAAHAVLGAAELLAVDRASLVGLRLLVDNLSAIPRPTSDSRWPWPEERLTYSNALLCEALIAAGVVLDQRQLLADGLDLLSWLVDGEQSDGHFSFTPTGGRGHGDPGGYDQQPIEAWSMATACARAWSIDRDPAWIDAIERSARWFAGDNDNGTVMWNPLTGGSFDGLTSDGANTNEGAESTIALIGTSIEYQRMQRRAAERTDR